MVSLSGVFCSSVLILLSPDFRAFRASGLHVRTVVDKAFRRQGLTTCGRGDVGAGWHAGRVYDVRPVFGGIPSRGSVAQVANFRGRQLAFDLRDRMCIAFRDGVFELLGGDGRNSPYLPWGKHLRESS